MLVLLMQTGETNFFITQFLAVGGNDCFVTQFEHGRILDTPHERSLLQQLFLDRFSRFPHRFTGQIGGAAGIRAFIKRSEIGIR